MNDVRWGFVGAGNIARARLGPATHWAEGAVLWAAAARDAERAQALEPTGRIHGSYRGLLEDDDVDAVYISLANDDHLPLILAALAAGKHVLCEKPLVLTADEVRIATAAAEVAGKLLVEAFWYRWHPRTRRLAELLEAGALGEVTGAEAAFAFDGPAAADPAQAYRYDPAKGGGALYDVGAYTLSGLHLALGPALEVTAADAVVGPTGVDLRTTASLRSPGGAVGTMTCGMSGPPSQHFVVHGSEASVRFAPHDQVFGTWMVPTALSFTGSDGREWTEEFGGDDPYRVMVEHVSAAIRGEAVAPKGEPVYRHPLADSLAIATTADAIRTRTR